ncbi:putative Cytochrome oxidase biogenesis protein Sco1/SenC/PrrC, copper metallochaperone [Rubrivivax sp. A210]|uniref:SCO family protein n=1 Tax=Rubrivivax sp. A210 TaxID=2772301 RepID=UPI00191B78BB|nr:SCO family protein [Rubrivivax sp. A210]CAD5369814.1 putative Cytochrome oxidase biogenesis protein Sco1/SenC/PrrC, copper metallochaperone [Rubrivivax sp. A210]
MKIHALALAAGLVAAGAAFGPARAAEDHSHHQHQAQAEAPKPGAVKVRYGDAQLSDQFGRQQRLKSDVIGDRIVVLDFVYTTCTTVCPVLTAALAQVQAEIGDGDDVRLVTITVDPARDTPARMKDYADKLGVKPGWVWLTGPTGRVNEVLKGFGAYSASFEDHPALVLIGDARTGQWTRFFGFTDPKVLIAKVQQLRAARTAPMPAGHKH